MMQHAPFPMRNMIQGKVWDLRIQQNDEEYGAGDLVPLHIGIWFGVLGHSISCSRCGDLLPISRFIVRLVLAFLMIYSLKAHCSRWYIAGIPEISTRLSLS